MPLLIETDIGRDLDDYLAICYLAEQEIEIEAISVTPGDPDQIALLAGLRAELGAKWKIGPSLPNRNKHSLAGVHRKLRQDYFVAADGLGKDLFLDALQKQKCDLFVIGPPQCVQQTLEEKPNVEFQRILVQGGFCGYHAHSQKCQRLPKFEGKDEVSTFNLNGCVKGAELLLEARCEQRRFVGKNVCHTVAASMKNIEGFVRAHNYRTEAKLFFYAIYARLSKGEEKKLHDVVAAVCFTNPEIGEWILGTPYRKEGKWGTYPDPFGDPVLVDINYPAFYDKLGMQYRGYNEKTSLTQQI